MPFLHNISTVARYEARTLRRSWFFRLFSLGAIWILTMLNIGLFSPVGQEVWGLVSIPSSLPLVNLYLVNIGQAVIVIFLASDFLKRDKKLDTNEVLYTRSMSNLEYITGKTWGILRLFLGLDLVILAIGLTVNITSKVMYIDFMAYIYYLLIICVPTLIFSLGLSFFLMSVIRNQAITFLILLGIAALNIFYLWFRMGSIFDYMAFGMPVFKSAMIGFDNPSLIINQRLLFLFSGLALVLVTVLLFRRLPQSRIHGVITVVMLVVFTAGAAICGFNTWSAYDSTLNERKLTIDTNRRFETSDFAAITDETIELAHNQESIEASAFLKIVNRNRQPLEKYILSLNPSLEVIKVTSSSGDLNFKRINHITEIDPGRKLAPGETDSLTVYYKGMISEAFCNPDHNDKVSETPYRIVMVNIRKRQAFLRPDFVLLTPETHWYPVAGLNYYPSNPARIKMDFTRFTLRIKKEKNLTAISQGRISDENGYRVFNSESPLTGMTLAIGNYIGDTLRVDSINYVTWHFPGNDYYKKDLAELKDTLPNLVSGIMRELETNFSTGYPFKTLSIVEVPVQFYSYPRQSTQTRAELQPSMVLVPEKLSTLQAANFGKQFTRQKKRMARNNQVITDKELKVRIFNNFVRNIFISGANIRYVNGVPSNDPSRYLLGPSFYFFKNNFYSEEYPVINSVFESHLQKMILQPPQEEWYYSGMGILSENDRANLILRETSFRDLLAKNPGGDTIRTVLTVKGDWLFNLLRSQAGIQEFKTWFSKYINAHQFTCVDIVHFNEDFKTRFGSEFYPYLRDWFERKDQPGFLVNNLSASQIVIEDRTRYQVTFNASNPEPVAGLFNISFRTGAESQGRGGASGNIIISGGGGAFGVSAQGRGMEAEDISKIVFLGPRESRRVGIVLDAAPRAMIVNTLFAQNIPGQINLPVIEISKAKGNVHEFQGTEPISTTRFDPDPGEIIVDNEDPGFNKGIKTTVSPLRKLLGVKTNMGDTYETVRQWNLPEYWQPVVLSSYYGRYVRSAVYTRAGTGDRTIEWKTAIGKPGYYDIYCYIGKTIQRMTVKGASGVAAGSENNSNEEGFREETLYKDMHYKIYHDEGVEDITLDYENAEGGWNNLGRYYISSDTAKVILSNQSSGRLVIGDAVRWVRQ